LGTDLTLIGNDVAKSVEKVESKADIDLFIVNNKSSNCNIQKEVFVPYNHEQMSKKFKASQDDFGQHK